MPPTSSQGHIESLHGVQIFFETHGAGEPLLLLHGFSGSSQDWLPSISAWAAHFQVVIADLHGHGRSGVLAGSFRHDEAANHMFALLDHLKIDVFEAVGISAGGNVLLHMATKSPNRVKAMVLVSATPYFPAQGRIIMRQYAASLPQAQIDHLRDIHPGGDLQINALLNSTMAFADSYDDMNFTPPLLSKIQARTLIVQGDHDPLCPIEISVEMARAIPRSSLWIIPNSGHGPVIGDKWAEFVTTSVTFLK